MEKKEIIELLIKMFPDCYISSIDGVIIYNPSIDVNYTETVGLRAESYVLKFKKELLEDELSRTQAELQKARIKNQEIIDAIIMGSPTDLAARILVDNDLIQGTLEYVMNYVEHKKESGVKKK